MIKMKIFKEKMMTRAFKKFLTESEIKLDPNMRVGDKLVFNINAKDVVEMEITEVSENKITVKAGLQPDGSYITNDEEAMEFDDYEADEEEKVDEEMKWHYSAAVSLTRPAMNQPGLEQHKEAADWHREKLESSEDYTDKKFHTDRMKHHLSQAKAKDEPVDEAAKPDYLDFDMDGNKKESMKNALRDKEEDVEEGQYADNELESIISSMPKDVAEFYSGAEMSSDLYARLFDYYSQEMPYGTQKARDGDPIEWLTDRFQRDLEDMDYGSHNSQIDEILKLSGVKPVKAGLQPDGSYITSDEEAMEFDDYEADSEADDDKELNELSKNKLGQYVNKASNDAAMKAHQYGIDKERSDEIDRYTNRSGMKDQFKARDTMKKELGIDDMHKNWNKAGKRIKGINQAVSKLTKEQVDQIEVTESNGNLFAAILRNAGVKTVTESDLNTKVNEKCEQGLSEGYTGRETKASAADKRGDYARGDKRFRGMVKATNKQFANDLKQGMSENTTPTPGLQPDGKYYNKAGRLIGTWNGRTFTVDPAAKQYWIDEFGEEEAADIAIKWQERLKKETAPSEDSIKYYANELEKSDVQAGRPRQTRQQYYDLAVQMLSGRPGMSEGASKKNTFELSEGKIVYMGETYDLTLNNNKRTWTANIWTTRKIR